MICRLYVAACRKYLPGGLTLSAHAHVWAQDGYPWARNRIDGLFLFWRGDHQHCQTQHQRDTRANQSKAPCE